ncbi:sugar transferase [Eupransor demetentiae]|uniref:Teichoic acid (WcaJ n=1 Tax=Eupransor demetentiae TaxID=3109584 RepID=A0ABM9N3E9_9LACO|nr:Sugar transferase involved in LPS biosynthesis (colanic [Lactobacillaceae bacterium LMG 33000]
MRQPRIYPIIKRSIDIVVALLALICLSPIYLVIAILIQLERSTSRIIYAQKRVGLHGKVFKIYKFQTMLDDAETRLKADPELYALFVANGYKLPTNEDPRITRLGRILRKTSLDELPQFWNVLNGTMSLIGPRPVVKDELKEYGDQVDEFLSVTPGVFGLWQASGRSNIHYPERAQIELEYVKKQSFTFDCYVFLMNIIKVFEQEGAF